MEKKLNSLNMVLEAKSRVKNCNEAAAIALTRETVSVRPSVCVTGADVPARQVVMVTVVSSAHNNVDLSSRARCYSYR